MCRHNILKQHGNKRRRVDQEALPPNTGAEGDIVDALLQLQSSSASD